MSEEQMERVGAYVMKVVNVMHERNQPYNIIMRQKVIHIIPRQLESMVAIDDQFGFGPAMIELYGIFIIKRADVWQQHEGKSHELAVELIKIMREKVSVTAEVFNEL